VQDRGAARGTLRPAAPLPLTRSTSNRKLMITARITHPTPRGVHDDVNATLSNVMLVTASDSHRDDDEAELRIAETE
jgi:hypothetical protein